MMMMMMVAGKSDRLVDDDTGVAQTILTTTLFRTNLQSRLDDDGDDDFNDDTNLLQRYSESICKVTSFPAKSLISPYPRSSENFANKQISIVYLYCICSIIRIQRMYNSELALSQHSNFCPRQNLKFCRGL